MDSLMHDGPPARRLAKGVCFPASPAWLWSVSYSTNGGRHHVDWKVPAGVATMHEFAHCGSNMADDDFSASK